MLFGDTVLPDRKERKKGEVDVCLKCEACCSVTFDVALVSDGLQGRAPGEELLQLVSGLLVVGRVHAGGGLHGC